jgi:hypothetical protein
MHVRRHLRAGAKYSDFIPFLLRLRFVVITKFRRIRDRDFGGEGSRCRGWDNIKKEKAKRRGKRAQAFLLVFYFTFSMLLVLVCAWTKIKVLGHCTRSRNTHQQKKRKCPIPVADPSN